VALQAEVDGKGSCARAFWCTIDLRKQAPRADITNKDKVVSTKERLNKPPKILFYPLPSLTENETPQEWLPRPSLGNKYL
jgi:hypothetical protein